MNIRVAQRAIAIGALLTGLVMTTALTPLTRSGLANGSLRPRCRCLPRRNPRPASSRGRITPARRCREHSPRT